MLERLGIASDVKSKRVFLPKAGPVGGIEIVGPLPDDLQDTLIFAAAVMVGSGEAAASKTLVDYLRSGEAAKIIRAKGMDPL